MSQNEQEIEWYLARDGRRHGPISDAELRKVVELGHLRPTDLVWRQGFANWEQAGTVFPETAVGPVAQPAPAPQPPQQQPAPSPAAAQPQPQAQPVQQPAPQRPAAPQPLPQQPVAQPQSAQPAAAPQSPAPQPQPRPQAPAPARPAAPVQKPADFEALGAPDPLQHRRVPQAATRRASGYGDATPYSPGPYAGAPAGAPVTPAPQPVSPQPAAMPGPGPSPSPYGAPPQRPLGAGPHPAGPLAAGPAGAPRPQLSGHPGPLAGPDEDDDDAFELPKKRRFPLVIAIVLLLLSIAGGAIVGLVKMGRLDLSSLPFRTSSTSGPANKAAPATVRVSKSSLKETPLQGYASTQVEVDQSFQKAGLWQLLKKEFPDWYGEVTGEVAKLKAVGSSETEISQYVMRKLVELRRKNAKIAFAAKPAVLKTVVQSFVDNLGALTKVSTDACYKFISAGETDPLIIDLISKPEHTVVMQTQMIAVFEAIVDGRQTKGTLQPADRKDYDVLAGQLSLRGWSPADLALFDDARALAQAPPQKVCQMVQDWFAAQLAVKEGDVQARLFGATLKPLIGD